LTQYRSLSEFFMRKLKEGVRPISDEPLVSDLFKSVFAWVDLTILY
jgi:phosphatidylserine decarboxylase